MKPILVFIATCLLIFQSQSLASAQGRQGNQQRGQRGGMQGQGQRGGQQQGPGGRGQTPPLFRIFDTDGNNELSTEEVAQAANVLKQLDKNQDGKITPDEFRPSGGQGRGGQQGRGMQGSAPGSRGQAGGGRGQQQGGGGRGQAGGPRGQQGGGGRGQGGGRGGDPAQADAQFAQQVLELDANQNNMISSDEIPEHMQAAFKVADADSNGSLNSKELLVLASQFRRNKLSPDGENAEMKNRPTGGAPQSRR